MPEMIDRMLGMIDQMLIERNLEMKARQNRYLAARDSSETLKPNFQKNWLLCVLIIVTGLCVVATIVFGAAVATTGELAERLVPSSTARTVLILRVLSEGLNISLTALITSTLTLILWTGVSRPEGIKLPTLLALSPTTRFPGLLQLLSWQTSSRFSQAPHRFWILMRFTFLTSITSDSRFLLMATLPTAGIIILSRTL